MAEAPPLSVSFLRAGLLCRCPKCGRGRLYAGYLKVVQNCAHCSFELRKHDAGDGPAAQASGPVQLADTGTAEYAVPSLSNAASVDDAKAVVQPILLERIDVRAANDLPRAELARQIGEIVAEIRDEQKLRLNLAEQRDLVTTLVNDMMGLGQLEQLLGDETITYIMVNGPKQVYIERGGKLTLTDVTFRDNAHLQAIALRIVTAIGRRID